MQTMKISLTSSRNNAGLVTFLSNLQCGCQFEVSRYRRTGNRELVSKVTLCLPIRSTVLLTNWQPRTIFKSHSAAVSSKYRATEELATRKLFSSFTVSLPIRSIALLKIGRLRTVFQIHSAAVSSKYRATHALATANCFPNSQSGWQF